MVLVAPGIGTVIQERDVIPKVTPIPTIFRMNF